MIKRVFFLIVIAVFLTLCIRTFVIEGIYVASASMEPTLPVGTKFFLEKITYKLSSPKRGDIVVFSLPIKDNHDSIKRIIASSGDEVAIDEKKVYVNSRKLIEPYVQYTRANEVLIGDNMSPVIVPKDMFFVMGDNRDQSGDSRDWIDEKTGENIYFINKKDIKGKLILFY